MIQNYFFLPQTPSLPIWFGNSNTHDNLRRGTKKKFQILTSFSPRDHNLSMMSSLGTSKSKFELGLSVLPEKDFSSCLSYFHRGAIAYVNRLLPQLNHLSVLFSLRKNEYVVRSAQIFLSLHGHKINGCSAK